MFEPAHKGLGFGICFECKCKTVVKEEMFLIRYNVSNIQLFAGYFCSFYEACSS